MTELLKVLDVQKPCTEPWEGMKGNAHTRHCERCNLSVYNLSEMTRAEDCTPLVTPHSAPMSVTASLSVTPREREVLACVVGGADNLKIAARLQISERTVKSLVRRLYQMLGAENPTQLALRGRHLGVRPPPDL